MKKLVIAFLLSSGALFSVSCKKICDDKHVNNTDCIDKTKATNQPCYTLRYDPVCGCNGVTYSSPCDAENAGVIKYEAGECGSKKQ